ncbi:MAG: deoxyribodipyrimidine photolyase [Deltaproteobacteria bacterium]|nr:deoxyribodipyrimidine photolyase [Deltaproteobacteria bacterium]MBW2533274.1 deoxyribodipyrimidine photolyase [Deltaproteobacteria bacterium]
MSPVPTERVDQVNDAPLHARSRYVLYWMIGARRTRDSFALERAVELGRELGRPVLVFEPLRVGYRWASDRLHRFVLDGMEDNAEQCRRAGVRYYPYVEPDHGHGTGLLGALAREACVVVTDHYPCFFLPRMVAAAARQLPVRLEQVDSNGLLPLSLAERSYPTAASFRRLVHRHAAELAGRMPVRAPLAAAAALGRARIPRTILQRWPSAPAALLGGDDAALATLPIDHSVGPSPLRGGARAGQARWRSFLAHRLASYDELRNHPDDDGASGLSPYLHFGHVSSHQVLRELLEHERWDAGRIATRALGKRQGYWGLSVAAEAFVDQLVTWRELGLNLTSQLPSTYDRYDVLPDWARATLSKHGPDERTVQYPLAELDAAVTHDPIWNAAQRQLRREGGMHNYLRMLWGKKILEWSATPEQALATLIELNNRYATDGRDPNSYTGILWTLGKFDRPWGPERPIFGTVRYMSSESTKRKLRLKGYLARFGRDHTS